MEQHRKLVEYLRSFTDLSSDYVNVLQKHLTVKRIEKGVVYFDKGTYSRKLGFLTEGVMRIYDIDESGNEWNKVFLSSPSLLLGNPNIEEQSIHYVEAITPCEVTELPMFLIEDLLKRYPETRELQTKILLHLFEKKSKREYDFLTLNAKERYLKCMEEYSGVINEIPQFHIASYLGITTTQLSRINVSIKNQQM